MFAVWISAGNESMRAEREGLFCVYFKNTIIFYLSQTELHGSDRHEIIAPQQTIAQPTPSYRISTDMRTVQTHHTHTHVNTGTDQIKCRFFNKRKVFLVLFFCESWRMYLPVGEIFSSMSGLWPPTPSLCLLSITNDFSVAEHISLWLL